MGGERFRSIRKVILRVGVVVLIAALIAPGLLSVTGFFVGDYKLWIHLRPGRRAHVFTIRCVNSNLVFADQVYEYERPPETEPRVRMGFRRPLGVFVLRLEPPGDLVFFKLDVEDRVRFIGTNDTYSHRVLMTSSFMSIGIATIVASIVYLHARKSRRNLIARGFEVLTESSTTTDSSRSQ